MTCDYKNVAEKLKLTNACDYLGNRWLDYIEALVAVKLHDVHGWGRKRIGNMYDGVSDMLSDYIELYSSDGEDIWETTLTANFSLERQLLEISVDIFGVNLEFPVIDRFGDVWHNEDDKNKHDFRARWIDTMESKLFVYYGVLFLWLNEHHGYGETRLMPLYREIRKEYVKFAEKYLLCKEKRDRELVRMIDDAVTEAKRICKEEEPVKTFISIDEFINKHKKYVPTA